jgi:hypothetical protein
MGALALRSGKIFEKSCSQACTTGRGGLGLWNKATTKDVRMKTMFDHTSSPEKAAQELQKFSTSELYELRDDVVELETEEGAETILGWVDLEILRRLGDDAFDDFILNNK